MPTLTGMPRLCVDTEILLFCFCLCFFQMGCQGNRPASIGYRRIHNLKFILLIFSLFQVWALYDPDYLPRYYAEINSVQRSPKFSCRVMWLEAERGETVPGCYFAAGLLLTMREIATQDSTGVFSHLVVPRASRYPMTIMPKLSEVWAFFVPKDMAAAAANREDFEALVDGTPEENLVYVLGQIVGEVEDGDGKDETVRVMYLRKVPGYNSVYEVRLSWPCALLPLDLSTSVVCILFLEAAFPAQWSCVCPFRAMFCSISVHAVESSMLMSAQSHACSMG